MAGSPWVVLPTYNEAENVEPLVRAVLAALPAARVLVVDDSSPDGTGAIADRLAAELPAVTVLHRPQKAGLGRAYVSGFAHALAGGATHVIEMDADFSHAPEDLPRLLASADAWPAAASRSGGSCGARSRARDAATPASCSGSGCAT
jgi:dolichol-phosphate mannosyltransferase